MSFHLTEDFKTLEELKTTPEAIVAQLRSTGRPIVVTMEGKPAAVMLDVNVFERLIHTLNLGRLLAEAEVDVRAGRTRPIEEFFKELLSEEPHAEKVSRGNRSRRRA